MSLWGEDSVNADRPLHLNADEGPQSIGAAFQTKKGWEIPLDGHNPELGLSEVIAAQSDPAQADTDTAPSFHFPQAALASGLTGKVGVPFEVFVRTVDVDGDVRVETTVLTDFASPAWATLTDLGNGVARYNGTPDAAITETFTVDALSGIATSQLSFDVVVSA